MLCILISWSDDILLVVVSWFDTEVVNLLHLKNNMDLFLESV